MALLTGSLMLELGAVFLGLAGLLYLFFTRNFNYWKKLGVPYLKPTPFVGNFKEIVLGKRSIGECLTDMYEEAGEKPFIGITAFDRPVLLVKDINLVKQILVKDFNYFPDRSFHPDEKVDPMLSKNLFGMKHPKWRHLRAKLTPTFTSGKMKMMFTLVDQCGMELVKYIDREMTTDGVVEVKEAVCRFTTDVIASCAFGTQANSLQDPKAEFRLILSKVLDNNFIKTLKLVAAFFAPKILTMLKTTILQNDVTNFLRRAVWEMVEYREKNGVSRNDFLQLMMQIRKAGHLEEDDDKSINYAFEGDDFVAQSFVFLIAGFETSSTTMGFALYHLAMNQDIQRRLREEIVSVTEKSGGQVTYDGMQDMHYLDMVVSETLRMYPVLSFLDRRAQQDYRLPGTDLVIKEGYSIMITVRGIHMDPRFYPEPDVFKPERFTEENKRTRPNYTYLPFGEGPRVCIGARMGLMQVKVGLIHILSQYEVQLCKETPVPLRLDPKLVLLGSKEDIPLKLQKVN